MKDEVLRRRGLLARMAGNIAGGIANRWGTVTDPVVQRDIAIHSVAIAEEILRELERRHQA